jgi:hypothetical protein
MTAQYGCKHVRQREVLGLVATLKEWSAGGVAIGSDAGGRKSRPRRDEGSKILIFPPNL